MRTMVFFFVAIPAIILLCGAGPRPAGNQPTETGKNGLARISQGAGEIERKLSSCTACHNSQCRSMGAAIKYKWIKPGDPENSPLYAILNKESWHHFMARAATRPSDADRKMLYEYIKTLTSSDAEALMEEDKNREPQTLAAKPDPFKDSFRDLMMPAGAMTIDREEMELRCKALDLAYEIAFLEAVSRVKFTADEATKLLPYARKVHELCRKRRAEYIDNAKIQKAQNEAYKNHNMILATGSDLKKIADILGREHVIPASEQGSSEDRCREAEYRFFSNLADLGTTAQADAMSEDRRKALIDLKADFVWVELSFEFRRRATITFWNSHMLGDPGRVGARTLALLLAAPNSVARLEKIATGDSIAKPESEGNHRVFDAGVLRGWRDEINSGRLHEGVGMFSGLNLSDKQITDLIDLLKNEVAQIHAGHAEANKKNLRPFIAVLEQIRDDAAQGKGISEEKKRKALQYRKGICGGYNVVNYCNMFDIWSYPILCSVHGDFTRKMEAVFKRLETGTILNPIQSKLIIETGHKCAPYISRNERDPIRVGEISTLIGYPQLKVMARLRALKGDVFARERDLFAAEIAGNGKGSDAQGKEVQRVTTLLDAINDMADADYELSKHELLSEILRRPCPERTRAPGVMGKGIGDIKDMTWDMKYLDPPHSWSPWDLMLEMEKAGKPMPSYFEKPLRTPAQWVPLAFQERMAFYLVDPDVVPSLEVLRTIYRNPEVAPVNLDGLVVVAETVDAFLMARKSDVAKKPAGRKPAFHLRINCAAVKDYVDQDGNAWLADRKYTEGGWGHDGGGTTRHPAFAGMEEIHVQNTELQEVYLTERYGMNSYRITVPENGSYTVKLHFAENYDQVNSRGMRVFSVWMGGKESIKNLDVFEEVGSNEALIRAARTEVAGNLLTIEFKKGESMNSPMINGIEVISEKTLAAGTGDDATLTQP